MTVITTYSSTTGVTEVFEGDVCIGKYAANMDKGCFIAENIRGERNAFQGHSTECEEWIITSKGASK